VTFDGGPLTSDGGVLLLAQFADRIVQDPCSHIWLDESSIW
jgi:hypothetical protein